jgi:hypothetical protein
LQHGIPQSRRDVPAQSARLLLAFVGLESDSVLEGGLCRATALQVEAWASLTARRRLLKLSNVVEFFAILGKEQSA